MGVTAHPRARSAEFAANAAEKRKGLTPRGWGLGAVAHVPVAPASQHRPAPRHHAASRAFANESQHQPASRAFANESQRSTSRTTRSTSPASRFGWAALFCLFVGSVALPGCHTWGLRPAVTLTMARDPQTPKSALVYIDEQYIGTLAYIGARGIRLPEGEHRITVEKAGYFPFDALVVSNREPIHLDVKLIRIPD